MFRGQGSVRFVQRCLPQFYGNSSLNALALICERSMTTVITGHAPADFDAWGSMLAALKLWPTGYLVWPGTFDERLQAAVAKKQHPRLLWSLSELTEPVTSLVVVDTAVASRLDHVKPVLQRLNKDCTSEESPPLQVIVFDHHPKTSSDLYQQATFGVHRLYGAATTILVRIIQQHNETCLGCATEGEPTSELSGTEMEQLRTMSEVLQRREAIALTEEEATYLALAIYEDTGNFTLPSVTAQDLYATAYLRQLAEVNMDIIYHSVHHHHFEGESNLSSDHVEVLEQLRRSAQAHRFGTVEVVIAQAAFDGGLRNFSAVVQYLLDEVYYASVEASKTSDATSSSSDSSPLREVVFGLGQCGGKVILVGRAKHKGVIDVGVVCRHFGGGGHACAAAATVKELTLAMVHDELYVHIVSSLKPAVLLRNIMTQPPVHILSSKTVADASELLLQFRLKKLPVLDSDTGACVGIVDGMAVEKARAHSLSHLLVEEIMDTEFQCLSADARFEDAVELVLRRHQRLIPVVPTVHEHKLIGVVSRADVISLLMKEPTRFATLVNASSDSTVQHLLNKQPLSIQKFLKLAGDVADREGVLLYVVGGYVRDLLLSHDNDDVDLVVEGKLLVNQRLSFALR